MIKLPEWDSEFVGRSRRYTQKMNAYRVGQVLTMLAVPWCLAATSLCGLQPGNHPSLVIVAFFIVLAVLYVLEQVVLGIKRRQRRRMVAALLGVLPELALWCVLSLYWWLLFPGRIALAIGAWWVSGFLLGLLRYGWRKWALREAALKTKDYRLFGRRAGRSTKRAKHDRASLYELPKNSAFSPGTVMVLASDEPEVYVSSEAQSLLEADQLRTVIGHELGHSWSQHYVGCELGEWVRKLFFVPVTAWVASALLAAAPVRTEPILVFMFLTVLILIWKANGWVSNLLNRPRELGADLYAVEMTRTPEAFVEGMKRLGEFDSYNVFPNLLDALGLCSHPCIVKRLKCVAARLETSGKHSDAKR